MDLENVSYERLKPVWARVDKILASRIIPDIFFNTNIIPLFLIVWLYHYIWPEGIINLQIMS